MAQTRYLAVADGTISPEEQQGIDQAAALADSVRALKPEDAKSGRMISGAPASYWLDLRGYDPPSAARQVKAPMLILQGERDYQVTLEEFAKWKAALGSRRDVTFRSYAALNHLFIAGTGPASPRSTKSLATSRRRSSATSRPGSSPRADHPTSSGCTSSTPPRRDRPAGRRRECRRRRSSSAPRASR